MEYISSMILNGQHSVNYFRYAPVGMCFKINTDLSREARRLDVFVNKSTRIVMFLVTFYVFLSH